MGVTIGRILFTTDFSESARHAQQYAVTLANSFGATLHVLHVVSEEAFVPAPELQQRWLETEIDRARKQLRVEVGGAPVGGQPVVQVTQAGPPVHEIVKYAAEHEIDLIVIGTHGRTGLSQLIIGSIAEKVVRLATCPVLTVHPSDHQFVMAAPP